MAKAKTGNSQKYSKGGQATETPAKGVVTPKTQKAKAGDHDDGETSKAKTSPYRAINPNEYGMDDAANAPGGQSGQGKDIAGFEPAGSYTEKVTGNLSAFVSSFAGSGRMTAIDKGPAGIAAGGPPDHPGFKAVQRKIAGRYGGDMDKAGAILAASSRGASAAAKRKNPRLSRVG